ncbi:uncharacterized protein LOC116162283 [Photinus pyralis]|uniref:uncharacterized protein LOC116162283 n=1 Tax=Photinus pyralis TaxID=7054 RepID=UPI0012671EF5|nr:uncharacterized protein LOC116162283 [Photinus pyralis]
MTCEITSIDCIEDSDVKPVIVNFENGALNPGQEDNLLCRYYKTKENQLKIGAATSNMLYSGNVESNHLYNTFIGICNKKKTKIRLIAADFATLSPRFDESRELNKSIERLQSTHSQINKSFGSKRAKKKTEQQERMKVDIEAIKDQLEKTVAGILWYHSVNSASLLTVLNHKDS